MMLKPKNLIIRIVSGIMATNLQERSMTYQLKVPENLQERSMTYQLKVPENLQERSMTYQ